MTELLKLHQACKIYSRGNQEVRALDNVHLTINSGEFIAVTGPSGSGKSTLLHILGCLDQLTSGRHFFAGKDVGSLADRELSALRARQIGFIFQSFHLLPGLTVLQNVLLPCQYFKSVEGAVESRARTLLDRIGLGHRRDHYPHELSGGEMQRTAIARALMGKPSILLADEPTGNLDQGTSAEVMRIFQSLHQEQQMTILMVTHNPDIAALAKRRIMIQDGRVV